VGPRAELDIMVKRKNPCPWGTLWNFKNGNVLLKIQFSNVLPMELNKP
jgi:hypothetical protein